jgi:hypothetical protein
MHNKALIADNQGAILGGRNIGVHVTVLTNSLAATDVAAVHAGYQRYRKPLLEADVQLYELKPAATGSGTADRKKSVFGSSKSSLHAKTYVFGRKGCLHRFDEFRPAFGRVKHGEVARKAASWSLFSQPNSSPARGTWLALSPRRLRRPVPR